MQAIEDQPAAELLRRVAKELGDTAPPNLYRMLARNPAVLQAFVALESFVEQGQLSRRDRAVVALTVAVEVDCPYCQAALSVEADEAGVNPETISSVRKRQTGKELSRSDLLVVATRRIMRTHGKLGRAEIDALDHRGLAFEDLLEIVAVISYYTIATYANNIARTRIDPQYLLDPGS